MQSLHSHGLAYRTLIGCVILQSHTIIHIRILFFRSYWLLLPRMKTRLFLLLKHDIAIVLGFASKNPICYWLKNFFDKTWYVYGVFLAIRSKVNQRKTQLNFDWLWVFSQWEKRCVGCATLSSTEICWRNLVAVDYSSQRHWFWCGKKPPRFLHDL